MKCLNRRVAGLTVTLSAGALLLAPWVSEACSEGSSAWSFHDFESWQADAGLEELPAPEAIELEVEILGVRPSALDNWQAGSCAQVDHTQVTLTLTRDGVPLSEAELAELGLVFEVIEGEVPVTLGVFNKLQSADTVRLDRAESEHSAQIEPYAFSVSLTPRSAGGSSGPTTTVDVAWDGSNGCSVASTQPRGLAFLALALLCLGLGRLRRRS